METVSYPVELSDEFDAFSWQTGQPILINPRANWQDLQEDEYAELERQPCSGVTVKLSSIQEFECLPCSFVTNDLHPNAEIHLFIVHFCERRGDEAFYKLCDTFDIPDDVRVKIHTSNRASNDSLKLQCFDVLHRIYHRLNTQLTLAMIKNVEEA